METGRRDRLRIFAACFLRAAASSMAGVLLGVALPAYQLGAGEIGLIVSLGLGGMAASMLLATLRADAWGRRRFLTLVTVASAVGGIAFALGGGPELLAAAALVGAVNGMGRDRGAALIIEQAILPGTASDRERTRLFAWYNVVQDAGHAVGALLAGTPALLTRLFDLTPLEAYRITFWIYTGVCLLPLLAYAGLSRAVERPEGPRSPPPSPEARRVVTRISLLFGVDSLAGGFLTATLVSYFFRAEFGVTEEVLAPLFFGARVLNAFSHLGAAWLARRIGLVNTMVFTHLPSSVLLATLPVMPSFEVAAVLFLLREGLVEMDVPTRQSYVMALVAPSERTFASGVTNLVRTSAWAVAPGIAGTLMESVALGVPLVIGAGLKIAYDVALWVSFRKIRPPEEKEAH